MPRRPGVEDFDQRWDRKYEVLERHVAVEGSADVPEDLMLEGIRMGAWVRTQRIAERRGTLSAERKQRLERLPGWTWDAKAAAWWEIYAVLGRWIDRSGSAAVPRRLIEGYPLWEWCAFQRKLWKQGKLATDRVAALEALRGWEWEPHPRLRYGDETDAA